MSDTSNDIIKTLKEIGYKIIDEERVSEFIDESYIDYLKYSRKLIKEYFGETEVTIYIYYDCTSHHSYAIASIESHMNGKEAFETDEAMHDKIHEKFPHYNKDILVAVDSL